jgi:hypothetical protein
LIGLELHIQGIPQVLRYEQRSQVVLVGHSYGGMMISGIADAATDRVRRPDSSQPTPRNPGQPGASILPRAIHKPNFQ